MTSATSPTPWVLASKQELPTLTREPSHTYHLPIRTPEDDAKVLRPCRHNGEFPCKNGLNCTAVTDITGGPGVPLMAMAPQSRFCVLCNMKSMKAEHIKCTILEHTPRPDRLVQRWESKVGPGGYNPSCCIGPDETGRVYNGFISHVAVGLASHYTCKNLRVFRFMRSL